MTTTKDEQPTLRRSTKTLCGWFWQHHRATWAKICALSQPTCSGCVLNKQVKGLK